MIDFAKGAYVPIFRRPQAPEALLATQRLRPWWLFAAVAAVLLAGVGGWWADRGDPDSGLEPPPARFTLELSSQGALDVDRGSLVLPHSGREAPSSPH
ncbi:MAG: hypothetical protein QM757_05325 [Paludibaculum sp.]